MRPTKYKVGDIIVNSKMVSDKYKVIAVGAHYALQKLQNGVIISGYDLQWLDSITHLLYSFKDYYDEITNTKTDS